MQIHERTRTYVIGFASPFDAVSKNFHFSFSFIEIFAFAGFIDNLCVRIHPDAQRVEKPDTLPEWQESLQDEENRAADS